MSKSQIVFILIQDYFVVNNISVDLYPPRGD